MSRIEVPIVEDERHIAQDSGGMQEVPGCAVSGSGSRD
jgi:hypothetical protein